MAKTVPPQTQQIYERLWQSTRHSRAVRGVRCPICWRAALKEAGRQPLHPKVHSGEKP